MLFPSFLHLTVLQTTDNPVIPVLIIVDGVPNLSINNSVFWVVLFLGGVGGGGHFHCLRVVIGFYKPSRYWTEHHLIFSPKSPSL